MGDCKVVVVLTDTFERGQWWVLEIENALAEGTDEQRRAVAVLHNLLAQIAEGCVDGSVRS